MASFTLGTAAQATGMAKSSILRAIKRGALSATRTEDGTSWSINPAELARVFPLLAIPGAPSPQPAPLHDAMADVLVSELRATIADLRADRDHWRQMSERLSLPPPLPPAPPIEQDAPAKRLWRWLRSTA